MSDSSMTTNSQANWRQNCGRRFIAWRWIFTSFAVTFSIVVFFGRSSASDETVIPPQPQAAEPHVEPESDANFPDIPELNGPVLKDDLSWSETLRAVVLTAIPDQFEDRRHWGKTKEIFGGVRVEQKGLNLRFSERKRKVNHGMWHKYKIELIDPGKSLKLVIDQIHPLDTNRFQFQIHLGSKLRCRGDFEHWLLGVKGLNLTVVSEAEIEVIAVCETLIRTRPNPKHLFPDLCFEPKVNRVQIFLKNLDVRRIGEIRGDIAEGLGDLSRHDIENLLQAQEGRVVKKINEAIEKNRSRLQIPTSRLW